MVITGVLPDKEGFILFDLNKDTQEGPVKYLSSQSLASLDAVNILSISQVGTTVTVKTATNHNVVKDKQALIQGTINFNGVVIVDSTPFPNIFTYSTLTPFTAFETTGTTQPIVDGAVSTITLDPSYIFKYNHDTTSDINLVSDTKAYEPEPDGIDYSPYLTGTADGRVFAEQLQRDIVAAGIIKFEIVIIYPNDVGLGNQGGSDSIDNPPTSDKVFVWGV